MTPTSVSSRWFQPAAVDSDTSLRLFLFPHAGSGASIYKDWPALLPADVSYQCVQLPGRENRADEEGFTEIEPLLDALHEAITAELDDRPFAFFGHCLGACLAYRLALRMERAGGPSPVLVAASGWAPVGFRTPTREQAQMPVEEMMVWINALGSVPAEIIDDPKTLELVIAALRLDLSVVASYQDDGAALRCPLASFAGNRDPLMLPGAMASWPDRTPSYLGNYEFVGDHFYMNDADNAIVLTSDLVRHIRRAAA